jgi:pimeloyl-ACP methyl ester carboxylesterase
MSNETTTREAVLSKRSALLTMPGGSLYHEIRGAGPVLLFICGGPTNADIFGAVAGRLAGEYTVVTYDPRGNSRSIVDNRDEDQTIELHSEDAHRLLGTVGTEPAYVFGSSSGATVGLDLVARYPEQVRTLIAHEPPVVELLPDRLAHRAQAQAVYETYQTQGVGPAMMKFMAGAGLAAPTQQPAPQMPASLARNAELFLAHQFLAITGYVPDVAVLRSSPTRIVVAVGQTSRGQVAHSAALALAEQLGSPAVEFPDDHGGFMSDASGFVRTLEELLRQPGG